MSKFKREIRYHVIKLKTGKPVDCVVVEADWPEYEIVWQMIQDRIEGKPNAIAAAHAKGREAGLREAIEAIRGWNTLDMVDAINLLIEGEKK